MILPATLATLDVALAALASPPPRDFFLDGTLRVEDFFIAPRGGIFAQRLGGAQAAIIPAQCPCPATSHELTRTLVEHLMHSGQRVLHAVLPDPPPASVAALEANGFVRITDMLTLERDITPADAVIPERLSFHPVTADDRGFAALIEETFAGTQDLPELNGTRSVDETLDACRLSAKVEPPLWWVAKDGDTSAGVLQLAPGETDGAVELLYMGLRPESRGLGYGMVLGQAALAVAAAVEAHTLTLTRDVRNTSAGLIYQQLGFREVDRRGVWLKILGRNCHAGNAQRRK